jgi:hypothetical protein
MPGLVSTADGTRLKPDRGAALEENVQGDQTLAERRLLLAAVATRHHRQLDVLTTVTPELLRG